MHTDWQILPFERKNYHSNIVFNTGSISKTFVAYVILDLANEGKLSLNDSIAKYFPDFKNPEASTQGSYPSFTHAYIRACQITAGCI
jgi:CubicO group peptidase (beta-lactamase class C family)